MLLTCSLHLCSNCQTVSSSHISVALVDRLLVIIWVSAPLHSTLTQRKISSFSARLPDMFYHSFYTLICMLSFWTWLLCFCHRLCVTHYVIVNSICYCQVSIFFNISLSIHMCLLKCVSLILFLLSVADVLLSLNLCLPIEVFYHHNQSVLFTFCFISLLLLTMMY